jgi:hypothetical protein
VPAEHWSIGGVNKSQLDADKAKQFPPDTPK